MLHRTRRSQKHGCVAFSMHGKAIMLCDVRLEKLPDLAGGHMLKAHISTL